MRTSTILTLPLALALGCSTPEPVDTGPMTSAEFKEIADIYDDFVSIDGVAEVVDAVRLAPVTGYLDLKDPASGAWEMFDTLQAQGIYLSRSPFDRSEPWQLLGEGMPGWPYTAAGLEEEPEASWPSVAFVDVSATLAGVEHDYRALVVRRPGRPAMVFDPVIDPQSHERAWLIEDNEERASARHSGSEELAFDDKDACPDGTENWVSWQTAYYTCEGVWGSSVYKWRYQVNWNLEAECVEVTEDGEEGCHISTANTVKTSEQVQHWIDDSLQPTDGNNTYCDRAWPQYNIYFRVQTDSDGKADAVHPEDLDHESQGHHAYAQGMRIESKEAASAGEPDDKAALQVALMVISGVSIAYHVIAGTHWVLKDHEGGATAPWEVAYENKDDYEQYTDCGTHSES